MRNKLEHKSSLSNEPQASMMKFAGIVSLFLFCVLIVHVVDGRKHHHKRHGKERVRSEVGKQIVSKALRKTEETAEGSLDAVNADHNEATAVNKVQ